jgi:beta-lactamase regulating signal transducer with metallopeptidase domain
MLVNFHAIAQMSAERMLNCLAQGILIALFAWIVLRLVGRRNSGTRFAVWFCALVAIAATPFLQISQNSMTAGQSAAGTSAALTIPGSWALYLFAAWAVIAAFGLARVAAGLWHLRTIRKSYRAVDPGELDPTLETTLREFGSVRPVELCVSDELRVPTAIGFLKPAVVLPAWALHDLSGQELNTVLLHELAHLRRWDDWTNLAQRVVRALFFFHPAVWWVERRLTLEREMACDDFVLAQTANPRAYAACLVSLAEKNLLLRRGIALAQAAVGRMCHTTQRVLQILDSHRAGGVRVWKPAPWIVGAFSVVCLISSGHAPKLVAFDEPSASNEAQYRSAAISGSSIDLTQSTPARFVPAKFVDNSSAERTWGVLCAHRTARPNSLTAKPILLKPTNPSKTQNTQGTARVVQTRASISEETAIPQQAVFVVVEGLRYGNTGVVLWQVSVWRVTVLQSNRHVVPENSSKSI